MGQIIQIARESQRRARKLAVAAAAPEIGAPEFATERAAHFGPYCLFATQRLLLEGDRTVRLGSRAMEILIVLIEHHGKQVSNGDLMARVWPDIFVEPANLSVQIATLRRALGDGHAPHWYIINVPGRGYRFVAPVTFEHPSSSAAQLRTSAVPQNDLLPRVREPARTLQIVLDLLANTLGILDAILHERLPAETVETAYRVRNRRRP